MRAFKTYTVASCGNPSNDVSSLRNEKCLDGDEHIIFVCTTNLTLNADVLLKFYNAFHVSILQVKSKHGETTALRLPNQRLARGVGLLDMSGRPPNPDSDFFTEKMWDFAPLAEQCCKNYEESSNTVIVAGSVVTCASEF